MSRTKRKRTVSMVSVLALALAIGGVSLFAGTSVVHASETQVENLECVTLSATEPGLLGEGYLGHGGWGDDGLHSIDYRALLAEALGITLDDLQAAYEEARIAAIEQAVEQGLITREQADRMVVWGGLGRRRIPLLGIARGLKGLSTPAIDEGALLAGALGITVEELQAAREEANAEALQQAVEQGIITQEQADNLRARQNLKNYLDRDVLLAKALGMSLEELENAYAANKTLSDLLSEKKLDAATVRQNLLSAYEEALAKAVKDGVITQEQADQLQNGRRWAFGFGTVLRPRGRGIFRGHDRFGDMRRSPPATDEDTSGMRFYRPGWSVEGDSAL